MLSDRLEEWYGMPEFQPSKVDEEILVIVAAVRKLEAASLAVCEYFEADYDIPPEVADLRKALDALEDGT